MNTSTDTKFFTNDGDNGLYKRFADTLESARYFDALVGYFRISGFKLIANSLNNVEKIRILVGINTDYDTFKILQDKRQQDFIATQLEAKNSFSNSVVKELENSEDSDEVVESHKIFQELLKQNKLEIKVHPSGKIHAKVYISRYNTPILYGSVITGSSNFSENGLNSQYEFNVELKDKSDVDYALDKFEKLWQEGIDVSREYVDSIAKRTWLNDKITPYEIYLKLLYEYFYEDINAEEEQIDLPEGFLKLEYQENAVWKIKKIVDAYSGVFISDVVGLGKTYIAAMFAQLLPGKKLFITPPPVMDNWRDALRDFGVKKYDIQSCGMLKKIAEKINKVGNDYEYIFIDEAHRFRNETTSEYAYLKTICLNKKVILITATPLNNSFYDFKSLISLFQKSTNSDIPGIKNLDNYFAERKSKLDKIISKSDKGRNDELYLKEIKRISKEIRDNILKYIMIRRTRADIKSYFSRDIKSQHLVFPEVSDPNSIVYEFDNQTNLLFARTIEVIRDLTYSRYSPKLYLKKQVNAFVETQQKNLVGFMKTRLVKRLESSKYAFTQTLKRSIESYQKYIDMYNSGIIYISKDVNVFDYLDNDNTEELDKLLDSSEKNVEKYTKEEFQEEFIEDLYSDLDLLKEIYSSWCNIPKDVKKEEFIQQLKTDKQLKNSKLIIFTESAETGDDLYKDLNALYPNKVLFYSAAKSNTIKEMIKENFDPNNKLPSDNIRILITTDVLAEGINLHRSNIVVNYDLPWNPTRVLQRVGRVNRIGTEHIKIYIYNFFPTSKAEKEISLKANIISKLQAFHDALGEDAKYLSDTEEVGSFNLRGEQIYENLTNKGMFEDTEESPELKYLAVIRDVRDKEPNLFKSIVDLPKKIRTAKVASKINNDSLITFFRKGKLKKFCITQGLQSMEISFDEAIKYFECNKNEVQKALPHDYFEYLKQNKQLFDTPLADDSEMVTTTRGRSNHRKVMEYLRAALREEKRYTESDIEYIQKLLQSYNSGIIPHAISKKISDFMGKEFDNLKILNKIRSEVSDIYLESDETAQKFEHTKKIIVLSEFLYAKD